MYILHIETATKVCSVALSQDDRLLDYRDLSEGMNHTALLVPSIEALMTRLGIRMDELGAVAVSSGPGSYTGLRVGGSTGKGIAYGLKIPLVQVPTLLALALAGAEKHPDASYVLPMLDARRNEVYTALFSPAGQQWWEDTAAIVDQSLLKMATQNPGSLLVCGDGAFKVRPFAGPGTDVLVDEEVGCSARHLVKPAWASLCRRETVDPLHFVPSYLKPPNITQSKKTV